MSFTTMNDTESYIYVGYATKPTALYLADTFYKDRLKIPFVKYQIKETDRRIKTASFTSSEYFDVTKGKLIVVISSKYHENFVGIILNCEYDEDNGVYTYNCQDWSRTYISTSYSFSKNVTYYELIQARLIKYSGKYPIPESTLKEYSKVLSGLHPLSEYKQQPFKNIESFNPLESKPQLITDKSGIELIRDICFQEGACIDVYFNNNGILQIEPYTPEKWMGEGVYLTTSSLASYTLKADITNIITTVLVKQEDKLTFPRWYKSKELLGIDLTAIFGSVGTLIDNPNNSNQSNNGVSTGAAGISTSTPIIVNCDNIHNKSKDRKMLQDIQATLQNIGYNVTIGGIGPNYHVSDLRKAPNGACLFTIVGGLCAGTFQDMGSTYYQNYMKNGNKKVVLGCLAPPVKDDLNTLTWLPRAWDDNFSPGSFKGISNPGQYLKNHGINYVYGSSGTELGNAFAGGSTVNMNNNNAGAVNVDGTGTTTIDVNSAEYIEKEKQAAIEKMTESVRELLTFKIKIPCKNEGFKRIHTNSFMWTELPEEMYLSNFSKITDAMTGAYTRYSGYVLNRWYIEGVTITFDNKGLFMELTLNPFASSNSSYQSALDQFINNYTQATQKTTGGTGTESNINPRSDGKTDCTGTYELACNRGESSISSLQNKKETELAQGTIGKTGTNYANAVKGMTGKQVYKHLQSRMKYRTYWNNRDGCAETTYNKTTGNCADLARLLKACLDIVGQPCVIYHTWDHYLNGVLINGKWETVDLCYQSGRHPEYQTAGWNK